MLQANIIFPNPIIGIDEAGRGPYAGPVVAACVGEIEKLPQEFFEKLNDSKKLSAPLREFLAQKIRQYCPFSVQMVHHNVIDEINILQATMQAMQMALAQINTPAQTILIDGNKIPPQISQNHGNVHAIIGGDGKFAQIAAASIIAKVHRDEYMQAMARIYPQYGFEKHKGYGTKFHEQAILSHGLSPIHRRSFCKKFQ